MFFRHARLAETDGPATLFVTAAIWWLWKGLQPLDDSNLPANRLSRVIDLHLSAVAWALALLSKQGTAVYPLVFLILWIVIEKRWRSIGTWLISGAPITLFIIGAPWFLWIGRTIGWRTFLAEAQTVTEGSDHRSFNPLIYVPMFLMATLPWVGVMLVALITAIAKWKTDGRLRFLLLWPLSIALPLCFIGNKQSHYLMPLLPPLALITAWFIARSLQAERSREDESSSPERRALRWVVGITLLLGIVAAGAVFFVGGKRRGDVGLEDVLLSPAVLLVSLWGLGIFFRRPALAALFGMFATALLFPYVIGRWLPSLDRHDHRALAVRIHHRLYESNLRYCFYGPDVSVPLGWTLRQVMPQYRTLAELRDALASDPRLVVIVEKKNGDKIPPVPPPLELILEDRVEGQDVRVYFERSHRATAAPITNPKPHATRWLTRRSTSAPAATRPR
jgi:4-amino-4-deoxy-L-arabinose transferase-like glycosyltransferase